MSQPSLSILLLQCKITTNFFIEYLLVITTEKENEKVIDLNAIISTLYSMSVSKSYKELTHTPTGL